MARQAERMHLPYVPLAPAADVPRVPPPSPAICPDRLTAAWQENGVALGAVAADDPTLERLARDRDARKGAYRLYGQVTPGLDRMGRCAHLVNIVAYRLGRAVALLDYAGRDGRCLTPGRIGAHFALARGEKGGEPHDVVDWRFTLPALPEVIAAPDASALGGVIEDLFLPLVDSVATDSRLGRGALWRLVADGVAAGFLLCARDLGIAEHGRSRAEALVQRPGSRLANRQIRFLEGTVPAERSPTGAPLRDRFRLRGGCCRLYTANGGDYCRTCVHRSDRDARLRDHMIETARRGSGD